jgi:predicted ATPase
LGDFGAALMHLEQARADLDRRLDPSPHLRYAVAPAVQCRADLAQLLWCLGYPDQALKLNDQAARWAREISHLHTLTYSMYFAIRLHLLRGETKEADELAKAALSVSTKHGFTFWTGMVPFLQGWSLCLQGQEVEGVARMRTGFSDALATGTKIMRPMFCALLADAYGRVGQLEQGRRMLSDALDAIEESGQRYYEAETYRFRGELQMRKARPDVKQAEASFQHALDIARHQQAKSWELRAAMSLAHLWAEQGKRHIAHDLLAPVYSWFTEGFDTADLKDAKALLDELA